MAWQAYERSHRKHDPVEYYSRRGGYTQPVALDDKITKAQADALAAAGYAYLIGSYDADGHLTRRENAAGRSVFRPAVQLSSQRQAKNRDPCRQRKSTLLEYDERGRLISNVRSPALAPAPPGD